MKIKLSDHFTYKKLFIFTLPSIAMMIFTSVYCIVDGFFVSNFAGKTPFAALNLIYPAIMVIWAVGFMIGAGGSALIAKTLGEGDATKANKLFSMFVYVTVGVSVVLGGLAFAFLEPIARLLGAEGEMVRLCVVYGRILLLACPAQLLQFEFQSFFITAEKPMLGFLVTVIAGITNIVLDALFVVGFKWGLEGAAAATAISQYVGATISVVYFARPNPSLLKLGKATWDGKSLLKACCNGSSEFLSNISMSVVAILYNVQLLEYAGEDGVVAYGVLMYVSMIFMSIFVGYSVGVAPVVGYHFGAQNKAELKNLRKKSILLIVASSIAMFALSELLALPLSKVFVSYDQALLDMTLRDFFIFSFSFVFAGVSIFASAFFTALNNGLVSAIISFSRTALYQVVAVLLLPLLWQLDGIWLSIIVAELLACITAVIFLAGNRKRYGY